VQHSYTRAVLYFHFIVVRGTLAVQTFNVEVVRLTTYSFKFCSTGTQDGVLITIFITFNVTKISLSL